MFLEKGHIPEAALQYAEHSTGFKKKNPTKSKKEILCTCII